MRGNRPPALQRPSATKLQSRTGENAATLEQRLQITLYGIRNCDTIKKARAWLDAAGVAYTFHDYRVSGVDREQLERWCDEAGWERVLNRAGTTYRKLPEGEKAGLNERKAVDLMLAHPAMIKRPVLEAGKRLLVGFSPDAYAEALGVGR